MMRASETGQLYSDRPNKGFRVVKDRLEALKAISKAVNRRRTLAYGHLDAAGGKHCAMGCIWKDHPRYAFKSDLVEEVAKLNDSVSKSSSQRTRWRVVTKWLKEQIAALESASKIEGKS